MTMPRRFAVVLFLALLLPLSARAVTPRWTPLGPYGGEVTALAVAPSAPRTVYAGTYWGGFFRSDDAGAHWERTSAPFTVRPINSIAVDPRDSRRVYAALSGLGSELSPLLVSSDGGATWMATTGLDNTVSVNDVAVSPVDPSFLLASNTEGLSASHDRGESWSPVPGLALERPEVGTVRFDSAGTAWALSPYQEGLFRSTDGGATWQEAAPPQPADTAPVSFAIDPSAPGRLYLELGGGEVLRTVDGGATWTSQGRLGEQASALAVSPDGAVLYAATPSGARRSVDGGATWGSVAAVFEGIRAVSLAVPPSPAGVVYAGSGTLGVVKGVNRGASWRLASKGLEPRYVYDFAVAPSDGSILYAAMMEGLSTSRDRGASWVPALVRTYFPLRVAVHPRDARIAWMASDDGNIAQTRDAGQTWSVAPIEGGRCVQATALAVNPRRPAELEVAGSLSSMCERWDATSCLTLASDDGGDTWTCNERQGVWFTDVAIDPVRPRTLYGAGNGGFSKSTDGGRTWAAANGGLTLAFAGSLVETPAGVLYAGTFRGVYVSRDGARTWKRSGTGISNAERVSRMAVAPSSPAVLYASASRYVAATQSYINTLYETADGGATWHPVPTAGLPENAGFTALSVDPRKPRTVYASTRDGIFRLDR
jgi:photosystem II stability/assembly factor-like uncharacterized protein